MNQNSSSPPLPQQGGPVFSVFRPKFPSWSFATLVLFIPFIEVLVIRDLLLFGGKMPGGIVALIIVALVTFPLPWFRGMAFSHKLKKMSSIEPVANETAIANEAETNVSAILVLGFKTPLLCFVVILYLLQKVYGT